MNQKAQNKNKALNPKGKPSREELVAALQPFFNQLNQTTNGICLLTDFLIEKGVVSTEEFKAFITTRTTPPQAQKALPEGERILEGAVSS